MEIWKLPNLVTALLSIFLATFVTVYADDKPVEYCESSECRIAGEILFNMNRSIDPCTNFYEHACGAWKANHSVTDEKLIVNHFGELTLKIQTKLSELVQNIGPDDTELSRKVKTFYDSCVDLDTINRRSLGPINDILIENGEWPLSVSADKWNPQNLTWQQIHENFANKVYVSAIFDMAVEVNRNNSSVYILSLGVPTVPSVRSDFLSRRKRNTGYSKYNDYINKTIEAITNSRGLNVDKDDLSNDIKDLFALENSLDELTIIPEENDTFRMITIETLQREWETVAPNDSIYAIDWLKTINSRFNGTGIVVDSSEIIALQNGTFATDLAGILVRTPVRTIVNYIHWKSIDVLLPLTNSTIKHPRVFGPFAFDRPSICINVHKMRHAIAYIYVKNYFTMDTQIAAVEMIRNIRDEIKREIMNCSWLDDATKLVAQEKAEAITNFIGYPEWYDEPGKIDEYYNELTLVQTYFENVLASNAFDAKKSLARLRRPVSKTDIEWFALAHIINAAYDPETNSMNFPAAILQLPFFQYERSSVLNYGALGGIVGHEISHGFDNAGRLRDKDGNERKWWSQSAIDSYKTKAQCFIEQFNNYTFHGDLPNHKTVHANGKKTLGENIADTAGFRAALKAYQTAKSNGKINNVKIELLKNYSDEQLFFYGLANTFCELVSNRGVELYATDPHSPNQLRIIGALSNMQEFADAFNCPVGSSMNPSKKCHIWD